MRMEQAILVPSILDQRTSQRRCYSIQDPTSWPSLVICAWINLLENKRSTSLSSIRLHSSTCQAARISENVNQQHTYQNNRSPATVSERTTSSLTTDRQSCLANYLMIGLASMQTRQPALQSISWVSTKPRVSTTSMVFWVWPSTQRRTEET